MNDAKLSKLEAALSALETAAGLRADYEVIWEGEDQQTEAELVIERVNFKPSPARLLEQRNAELAAGVEAERAAFKRTVNNTPYKRLADAQSVSSASGCNDSAADDATGMQ